MAKKKTPRSKATENPDYPFEAVTIRDALLQGPDIVIPKGHSITVHGICSGLGVVSTTIAGAARAGLMSKSSYRRA